MLRDGPQWAHNVIIWLLEVLVVCNVSDSGEELLHCFIFLLLHIGEIGDNNTVVGLDPEILKESSSYRLVIICIDFDH
jgi:hypothetical protein